MSAWFARLSEPQTLEIIPYGSVVLAKSSTLCISNIWNMISLELSNQILAHAQFISPSLSLLRILSHELRQYSERCNRFKFFTSQWLSVATWRQNGSVIGAWVSAHHCDIYCENIQFWLTEFLCFSASSPRCCCVLTWSCHVWLPHTQWFCVTNVPACLSWFPLLNYLSVTAPCVSLTVCLFVQEYPPGNKLSCQEFREAVIPWCFCETVCTHINKRKAARTHDDNHRGSPMTVKTHSAIILS